MDWSVTIAQLMDTLIPIAVTLFSGLLSKYVYSKIKNDTIKGIVGRATGEIFDATREVFQTYAKGIKKGAADGKLTAAEKSEAKRLAIDIAKSNIGLKGMARLAKIVGANSVDSWLATKVESSVHAIKSVENAPANPQ